MSKNGLGTQEMQGQGERIQTEETEIADTEIDGMGHCRATDKI